MFLVLTLLSTIPVVVTLLFGTLMLREIVMSTGSAGAWDEVARSGRELFDQIRSEPPVSPDLASSAARHESALAESVRFSRLYAFLGDRVLLLLPGFALLVLALVGGLALVASNWFSRDLSRPLEELVGWTRLLAAGGEIPPGEAAEERRGVSEVHELRDAFRTASDELRVARAREVEQARIQSWAGMARKIAHELKNPLTPMAMAATRVAQAGEPAVAEAGAVLQDEIRRLDELARTFARFGKPPEGPRAPVDMNDLLSSLVGRLERQGLPIELDLPASPIYVEGYLSALEGVMRNLISNAQEAVEAKAVPDHVGAAEVDVESREPVRIVLRRQGAMAEVCVLDRGTGIPDEILTRIWEPELTTKRKGTGLGLAMVYQVVRAHDGVVAARNREGGGAEFTLRIRALSSA